MRASDLDLRAGRVELGATLVDGEMERDDFVSDEILACRDIGRESHGYETAVHYARALVPVAEDEGQRFRYALTSCWYHTPSGFLPIWSILNHLALEPLNLSQVEVSHGAIYIIIGPVLCGHCGIAK